MRAGRRRAAILIALTTVTASAFVTGCGGGDAGPGGTADAEKAADAEIVNTAIGQELTLIDAYRQGLPLLGGEDRRVARHFIAQEQEHINGLTKLLRGLNGDYEGEAGETDFSEVKSERDFLTLAYEMTSDQLTAYIYDVPSLATPAPQALAATMAANEAQHLVVLRQALGLDRVASVPEGYDNGEIPAPLEKTGADRG